MNAPMQGNGAEMMRLAAIFGHQAGVTINAPLHDAFMIEAREEDAPDAIQTMKACMVKASSLVLDGVEIGVDDKKVIAWPDRYMDDRVGGQGPVAGCHGAPFGHRAGDPSAYARRQLLHLRSRQRHSDLPLRTSGTGPYYILLLSSVFARK